MEIQKVSMKEYSSLRIGGEGNLVVVKSEEELVETVNYAEVGGSRIHILGSGTNTYFGEDLKNILFIKIELKGIVCNFLPPTTYHLQAYSGELWDDIVKFSVEKDLWGIENLSLIPGTVGAAPVQNIGAYGVELKDILTSVRAYDMKTGLFVELSNSECEFGYRDSLFKREKGRYIITSITLELSKDARPVLTYKPLDVLIGKENITVQEVRDSVIATRKAKLPDWKEYPNAGSFFKNPIVTSKQGIALLAQYPNIPLITHPNGYKIPAAWLIEHITHMKGVRVGDLGIWPNQPLVVVNYGNATYEDMELFSQEIIEKIKKETGIILEKEVNRVT